ncbi:MAG: carboxypeptidase-like regulatory domain-containing protein [Flavobacteriaceae bacterium]
MKFYIACIQKLKELVDGTSSNTKSTFAACSSLRVFEAADFEFLSGQLLNAEQFLNSEDISAQLNSLGTDQTFWDVDAQANLYEYYKTHLEQLKLKGENAVKLSEALDKALLYNNNGEPSEKLLAYNDYLEQYETLIDGLNELYNNADADVAEDEKKSVYLKADIFRKKIALLLAQWRLNGFKDNIENALKSINKLSEYDQILELKNKVLSDIKNIEATGIQSASTYIKLQMVPYNFYKQENAWTGLEVTQNELNAILIRAQKQLKGFNNQILGLDYDETFINKITLNYCIITIKRPWLYKDLLQSEYIDSNTKKATYKYAKKIVLIKDLRVILKEDLSEAEKEQIQNNNIIKFGPIFMKNQFFINNLSKEAFIKPVTDKKIYTGKFALKLDKKLQKATPLAMPVKPNYSAAHIATVVKAAPGKPLKNPIKARKPIAGAKAKPLVMTAKTNLIFKIPDFKINLQKQSNIHINITDKLSKDGIYKAELSFKSLNTNFFKNIETNENGLAALTLPKGNYDISIRKNGYKELKFTQIVQENKNITISKILEPQEVVFDSYFLMGIIADEVVF